MSELRRFFLGRGELKSPQEIVKVVQQSPKYNPDQQDAGSAEPLLIFQSSKQQTWLVATRARLYCVLDDLPRSRTRVQWAIAASDLGTNGNVTVPISTRDKTDRTGLLDLGPRRGWLFSKKLFASMSIENQIRDLIRRQMLS